MLHFICAFKSEAQPLLEHYSLKHQGDAGLFNIYLDKSQHTSLTICGMGKISAASAVLYCHSRFPGNANDIWINLGGAGHREREIGELLVCERVEDAGSGKAWYPQLLVDTAIPAASLLTLDRPFDEYSEKLYDMEASGVFHAACRVSTLEFIHALKIVSDNEKNPLSRLDRNAVSQLVAEKLEDIVGYADSLWELSRQLPASADINEDQEKYLDAAHFTSSQQSQLLTLLQRHRVLFPGRDPCELINPGMNASNLLRNLREHMDDAPFRLQDDKPRD